VDIKVLYHSTTVPEFTDPVFGKTSPKRPFLISENERFGIVFSKTGSINSGTAQSDDFNYQRIKKSLKKIVLAEILI
jgi:hypothetical protein